MARALIGSQTGGTGVDSPTPVLLDDGCGQPRPCCDGNSPEPPTDEWPTWVVRERVRDGYDAAGNPVFRWKDLISAPGLAHSERTEWDAEAGITVVNATVTIGNPDDVDRVTETAIAYDETHDRYWNIRGADTWPGRVELRLRRVWHENTEGAEPDDIDYGTGSYGTGGYGV